MRILPPLTKFEAVQRRHSRLLASLTIALGVLMVSAKPAWANHVSTAQVTTSCTSYTFQVSAGSLVSGKSYTITYKLLYTPGSGSATTITGSIPFTAPASGTYSTSVTKPINLITDTYKLTGTATLVTENTINVTFSPTTLSCVCPD